MFTLMAAALTGCGSSTQAQTTDTQAVAEAQEETAETPEAEDPETEQAETAQQTDEAAVSETEAIPLRQNIRTYWLHTSLPPAPQKVLRSGSLL